jgi:hypothetical protein
MEKNVNTPEPQESAKNSSQAEQAAAEQPKTPDQPEAAQPTMSGTEISKDARMWAMFCHLAGLARFVVPVPFGGIIAPLIVWQIKKDEHPFVDENDFCGHLPVSSHTSLFCGHRLSPAAGRSGVQYRVPHYCRSQGQQRGALCVPVDH